MGKCMGLFLRFRCEPSPRLFAPTRTQTPRSLAVVHASFDVSRGTLDLPSQQYLSACENHLRRSFERFGLQPIARRSEAPAQSSKPGLSRALRTPLINA